MTVLWVLGGVLAGLVGGWSLGYHFGWNWCWDVCRAAYLETTHERTLLEGERELVLGQLQIAEGAADDVRVAIGAMLGAAQIPPSVRSDGKPKR